MTIHPPPSGKKSSPLTPSKKSDKRNSDATGAAQKEALHPPVLANTSKSAISEFTDIKQFKPTPEKQQPIREAT